MSQSELTQDNEQLRKDVTALEGEVLAALHHGVANNASIWRTTVGEVVAMRDELVLLVQVRHARSALSCNGPIARHWWSSSAGGGGHRSLHRAWAVHADENVWRSGVRRLPPPRGAVVEQACA